MSKTATVYIDASFVDGEGAAAMLIRISSGGIKTRSKKLTNVSSSTECEQIAASLALNEVAKIDDVVAIDIFTDSLNIVEFYKGTLDPRNYEKNKDCLDKLGKKLKFFKDKDIRFFWVRSHSKDQANRYVDAAARVRQDHDVHLTYKSWVKDYKRASGRAISYKYR